MLALPLPVRSSRIELNRIGSDAIRAAQCRPFGGCERGTNAAAALASASAAASARVSLEPAGKAARSDVAITNGASTRILALANEPKAVEVEFGAATSDML